MQFTVFDYILVSIAFVLFIIIVVQRIIWRIKKRPFTRERFAFFGVTSLITLITFIIPYLFGNNYLILLLNKLTNYLFNFSFEVGVPDFSDKILMFLIIVFVGFFILRIFKNWHGKISLRQFELEKLREKASIIKDLKAFFNENEKLREFSPHKDETIRFDIKEPVIESIAWHVQVYDLLTLSSNQYKIDVEKDWFQKESCFLSKYGKQGNNLAILCLLENSSKKRVEDFISFANGQYTNNTNTKFIVAIKNTKFQKYYEDIQGVQVEYTNEEILLNELIDFSDYFNYLKKTFEEKEIIKGYKHTLKDVYTEPTCKIKSKGNDTDKDRIIKGTESYIFEWINNDKSNKHLAILGEYGQGKSVLSQRIAYLMATNYKISNRVPIIIELRGRYPKQYPNSLALLSDWGATYRINPVALLKLHYAGKLVIIFEGFDEMELIGDYEIRVDHFRKLWGFSTPNSKIIITGRPNFFLNENELKTLLRTNIEFSKLNYCEEIYLKRFSLDQIESALRSSDPETKEDILKILKDKNSDNSFYDLMSRPSSIFLTSIVWKERNISKYKNNINSALVIEEFLKHSYTRQESKDIRSPLSIFERAYFMQGIAVGMVHKNRYTNQISQNELRELILKLYQNFPDAVTQSDKENNSYKKKLKQRFDNRYNEESVFLDVRSCGILVRDLATFDSFKFSHKSFLELLVSNFIVLSYQELNEPEDNIDKIIRNSISNTLDVSRNMLPKSSDVMKFIAEQFARKIKIPKNAGNKDIVRYVFKTIYPFRYLGMEKIFKLMPYLGSDIRFGIIFMSISLISSISFGIVLGNKLLDKILPINVSDYIYIICITVFVLFFCILVMVLTHRVYINKHSILSIDNTMINYTKYLYEKYYDSEIVTNSNLIIDRGNLLLIFLTCKELGVIDSLRSIMPKKIFILLESQEKDMNRYKNGAKLTEEDYKMLMEQLTVIKDNS